MHTNAQVYFQKTEAAVEPVSKQDAPGVTLVSQC